MSDYILEMKHIVKDFSGVKALNDVNLKVKRGEVHALCGENGAGKSTLMNVLSGIYPFGTYTGDIVYNGEIVKNKNIKDSEKKGIVIIHQELALSPYLSIAENVFLGNEQMKVNGVIDWTQTRNKAQEMLEKVVDLAEQILNEEQRIFTLSGVIVASDKFIDRKYLEQIRRRIHMTQLGQLYEKEKIEYGNHEELYGLLKAG